MLKPDGARLDRAGNAAGVEFDLGAEGAFRGLRVVVCQQYTGEGFDFRFPRAALEVSKKEGKVISHVFLYFSYIFIYVIFFLRLRALKSSFLYKGSGHLSYI
jgi:hypothetical protein